MADDQLPIITYGGPGSGVAMWLHSGTEFTNASTIIEDEIFRAEGDADPNGGGPGLILNNKRGLSAGDVLLSVRSGDAEKYWQTHQGHPVLSNPVWDDYRIGASVIQIGPANQPSWDVFIGSIRMPAFAVNEEVFFDIQLPHDWKPGSQIRPHVHWAPNGAVVANNDQVKWAIEYEITDMDEVYGGTATITGEETMAVPGIVQKHHFLTEIGAPLSMTGFEESCVMICRLYRTAASAQEYAGDAVLLSFDLHYQKEKQGTYNYEPPWGP
jgi:hypothetical protein